MVSSKWIDAIHTRLLVRYGSKWLSLWAGIDEAIVKADWSKVLDGLSVDSISYALENLPQDYPPNANQFLSIARRAPAKSVVMIEDKTPPDPDRVNDAIVKMKGLQRAEGQRAWAYALRDKESRGVRLTKAQRDMWRAAINS